MQSTLNSNGAYIDAWTNEQQLTAAASNYTFVARNNNSDTSISGNFKF